MKQASETQRIELTSLREATEKSKNLRENEVEREKGELTLQSEVLRQRVQLLEEESRDKEIEREKERVVESRERMTYQTTTAATVGALKHQLKEEEERRTDVTQRCTRMEAEQKVSMARADVERERLVQLQAELLEARELLARSETTSQSNAATTQRVSEAHATALKQVETSRLEVDRVRAEKDSLRVELSTVQSKFDDLYKSKGKEKKNFFSLFLNDIIFSF